VRTRFLKAAVVALAATAFSSYRASPDYDVLITGGTVIDGSGAPGVHADVGIRGDRIAAIGDLEGRTASRVIDARGLVVAPGFIDMLGWSQHTILVDSRGVSKVTQGVTTEITGEGWSAAPVNANTLRADSAQFAAWGLVVDWHDLNGYFARLERSGTPFNLATYVGATTVRQYVLGDARRAPTPAELLRMEALVDTAMRQGALGVSTSLGYAPGVYASTSEIEALAHVAARYGGVYATHLRSESSHISQALTEAFEIGRAAGLPVEVWHLKVSGRANWGRMPAIIARFDSLRAAGRRVGANSYPYAAGATTLDAAIPAWAHAGGKDSLLARLARPAIRARLKRELGCGARGGSALSDVMVLGVLDTALRRDQGRRLTDIAKDEHRDACDVLFEIVTADHANAGAAFFSMSESDVRAAIATPWIGVGMDYGATAPDGPLAGQLPHPRAYGTFPRILGKYVREEHVLSLEAAIHTFAGVPAERLGLAQRGVLREGYFADVTVFDPATVADRATYADPAQLSVGIRYVLVNGQLTLDDGHLTPARPGRALRGPGWHGTP